MNGLNIINFSANDYLGLANHPDITNTIFNPNDQRSELEALEELKRSDRLRDLGFGSGAAHLVSGHHLQHHLLEDELADWLDCERVLLFSTGYMANLAVLQTLTEKGDIILGDKLNHASLVDGARQAEADFKRYAHLDMTALEKRLQQAKAKQQQAMVVTDGVFSMDGDIASLDKILTLCEAYNAWLYVDDAHGIGTLGDEGRGIFEHFNRRLTGNTIYMGTLGKAFGCFGAFVAGSELVIESLIQFARPYIYTTAMPPVNALAARNALKLIQTHPKFNEQLYKNIQLFKDLCHQADINLLPSDTAIQPLIIGEPEKALYFSDQLKLKGFWVTAIRPPTVPKGTARLRITLSASHTRNQIESLVQAIASLSD